VLGVYAISRRPVLERGLVWTGGVFVGLLPLLAFNQWAFGSFTQLSYSHLVVKSKSGGPVVVVQPAKQAFQPRVAVELLLSARGLLTLAPIVAVGIAGAVFLYRRRLPPPPRRGADDRRGRVLVPALQHELHLLRRLRAWA